MPIYENKAKDQLEQAVLAICNCRDMEHFLKLSYFDDDASDDYLYVQTHLAKKSWLQRIKYAFKYIFGFQSRFGAFDETLFTLEEAQQLTEFLNTFIQEKSAQNNL